MSSSPATAPHSRSSSPHTPDSSDSPEHIFIDNVTPWYSPESAWDSDTVAFFSRISKAEEENMLCLNDLINEQAYDECAHPYFLSLCLARLNMPHSLSQAPSQFIVKNEASPIPPVRPVPQAKASITASSSSNSLDSPQYIVPCLSRNCNLTATEPKVICPPKESCHKCVFIILKTFS